MPLARSSLVGDRDRRLVVRKGQGECHSLLTARVGGNVAVVLDHVFGVGREQQSVPASFHPSYVLAVRNGDFGETARPDDKPGRTDAVSTR